LYFDIEPIDGQNFGTQPIVIFVHILINKFGMSIFWYAHNLVGKILEPNQSSYIFAPKAWQEL
jgi:hypothetical protein